MPDIPTPLEMGFAEFVAKLIEEVGEAIAMSQAEQEHRQADIAAMASLTPEEFADRFIPDEQVDAELARLFPTDQPKRPHAIFPGAAYRPKQPDVPESPPIGATLGVELERADYQITRTRATVLSQSAVDKVKQAVRLRQTQERLFAARQLVVRGMPRVIIDSGRINAKLSFQVIRTDEAAKPEVAARLATPLKPLGKLAGMPVPRALANVRLLVRQANDRAPQTSQLQVNVFGEVEITFKTVT